MPDLERRIDEISRKRVVDLETRYRRVAHRLTTAVFAIGITLLGVAIALVVQISENTNRSKQIQDQRARTIYDNCVSQNARHDDALRKLSAAADASPEQGPGKQADRVYNVLLIDSLAPKRNCHDVVRAAVKMATATTTPRS